MIVNKNQFHFNLIEFLILAEVDAIVIGSGDGDKSAVANTKLFGSNDVTVDNNAVVGGLIGLGVGVGGVLLAQHLLDKPECRYRRFDMGGLLGGNKNCNPKPQYPNRPRPPYNGGGYREPHRPYRPPPSYEEPHRPYRPSRPYKEPQRPSRPYRPQRPYDDYHSPSYEEPYRPYRPTQRPYREPHRPAHPYREPATPYRNPKPDYQKPAVYRPPTSYHEPSSPYYPNRPIRGRNVEFGDSNAESNKEEKKGSAAPEKLTNDSNNTGELLSGRVRFMD